MPHDSPLIATIVIALTLAWAFGALAHRLKLPPLVGYLVAGILIGPHFPGFVADAAIASQLAANQATHRRLRRHSASRPYAAGGRRSGLRRRAAARQQ